MPWMTTLNAIRAHSPCKDGWQKLLTHLGKTRADEDPLAILTVLDSNGLDDALWCLRAVTGKDTEIRFYVVWCARQVQHLMTDQRSIAALDVAESFANGQATRAELDAARASTRATIGITVWSTARSTARVAAIAAASDFSPAADWEAAWVAAWDAARDAQEVRLREVAA